MNVARLHPHITHSQQASGLYYAWIMPDEPLKNSVAIGGYATLAELEAAVDYMLTKRLQQFQCAWSRTFSIAASELESTSRQVKEEK